MTNASILRFWYMRLPHRLQGQKVKSQSHGAGAYCGGHLAAQLVIIIIIVYYEHACPFLSRVSILTRDIDIAILSVILSIRHIPVFYGNGLTYCHSFFTTRQPNHSSFMSISFTKFRRGHPCGGAKYRWGIRISRFSTNKSLYLENDTDSTIVTMER